jgi:hypothetical protein
MAMTAVLAIGCSIGRAGDGDRDPAPAANNDAAGAARAIDLLKAGTAFIDQTSFRADVDIAGGQLTIVARADNVKKRADSVVSTFGAETETRTCTSERTPTCPAWVTVGWSWTRPRFRRTSP